VVQPQRVFQFAVVVLHSPAQLGQVDQPLQRDLGGQVREPVLDRLGLAWGPLGQQPAQRQLPTAGHPAQLPPSRTHPQGDNPRGQLLAFSALRQATVRAARSPAARTDCLTDARGWR
jgi:hypothetical protein